MVSVLSEQSHVARKVHYCDFCGKQIEIGQRYTAQSNLGDDGFYIWKSHERCDHIQKIWWKIFGCREQCREHEDIPPIWDMRDFDQYHYERAVWLADFLS